MTNETNITTLKIPDIVCGGCAGSIKNALGEREGINQIEVDVESKIVSVRHDEKISRVEIERVLDDIGFPVEK